METPFFNDIYGLIWKAFKNLYPDKNCSVRWYPELTDSEGERVYGLTVFEVDGSVNVFVGTDLDVTNTGETLAHELAHVAVGPEHEHDEVWEDAFEQIRKEYDRIGDEMFEK